MAFLLDITCKQCKELKTILVSAGSNGELCDDCIKANADKKEREWKAGREGLTIEERLRELEHFMYHHGHHYKPIRFG